MVGWLFDLIGPIATKELIEIARRRRTYWLRAGYGLALLGCLWLAWEQNLWLDSWDRYGPAYGIRALAMLGESIFQLVAAWQLLAVYLIVPMLVAPAIVEERNHGSLDLLLTTSLSDREIILGKLASRLGVLFLLVLAALPILSLILLFGGVRAVDVWLLSGFMLLEMVLVGSIAIYFSTLRATFQHAFFETLVVSLIVGLGGGFLLGLPVMMLVSALLFVYRSIAASWVLPTLLSCWFVVVVLYAAHRFCSLATRNLRRAPAVDPAKPVLAMRTPNRGAQPTPKRREARGSDERMPHTQGIRWATLVEFRATPVILARNGFEWAILIAIGMVVLAGSALFLLDTLRPFAGLPLVACGIVVTHSVWLASVNPIFVRGGYRDILLAAPLDARELLGGATSITWWQVRPVMALVLPIVIAVIVSSDPAALIGLVTGASFVAATFLVGLACAIPNGNVKQSFACMLVFLVAAGVGPLALTLGFDLPRLSLTWGLTAALAMIARHGRGQTPSGWKVGAELTSAYLLFVTSVMAPLTYLFSLQSKSSINPYWVTSPIYWLATASGAGRAGGSISGWLTAQSLFCAAQILFVVWAWRWMNRHFDLLVGRPARK